jgi:hypothetical protein
LWSEVPEQAVGIKNRDLREIRFCDSELTAKIHRLHDFLRLFNKNSK